MFEIFSIKTVNDAIRILLLLLFTVNTGASLYMPITAIFISRYIVGATLATIGISVGIYSLVKSVLQIPIAKKLDASPGERDDFLVILFGVVTGIVYSFGFLFIHTIPELYALQILTGIGDACAMAAYYAIFSHHIDKNSEGFEWSLLSVGGLTVPAAIGASIGGIAAEHFGFRVVFIAAGVLNIIGALFLILLRRHIKVLRS